jgi:hypothetical protein
MNISKLLLFPLILFLFCFIVPGCKAPGNKIYTSPLPEPAIINSSLEKYVKKMDEDFGLLFSKVDTEDYFIFLDHLQEIHLLSIKDTAKHFHLAFANYRKSMGEYLSASAVKDSLWIMDISNKLLYQFHISTTAIDLKKVFNLQSITEGNRYYINSELYNTFEVKYPNVFIRIGEHKQKKNYFLAPESYINISLNDTATGYNPAFVLHTPRDFMKAKFHDTKTFLRIFNDSMAIYAFTCSDSIYTYNYVKNSYLEKSRFNEFSKFRILNNKKSTDLGYLRWYEFTSEKNLNIIHTQANTVIIKVLERKELTDTVLYEYYLLDKNMNVKYNNLFTHKIWPFYSFPYQKGFIVFGIPFNTIYYYEVD